MVLNWELILASTMLSALLGVCKMEGSALSGMKMGICLHILMSLPLVPAPATAPASEPSWMPGKNKRRCAVSVSDEGLGPPFPGICTLGKATWGDWVGGCVVY